MNSLSCIAIRIPYGCERCTPSVASEEAAYLSTAASHRLDHDRVSDLLRLGRQRGVRLILTVIAEDDWNVGIVHDNLAQILNAHITDGVRRWTDEDQIVLLAHLTEFVVLREKAIAGMNRLRIGLSSRVDDLILAQVTLQGSRWTDMDRFVRHAYVQCITIGIGEHGHRLYAETLSGAYHSAGYFASISDENLTKGHRNFNLAEKERIISGRSRTIEKNRKQESL